MSIKLNQRAIILLIFATLIFLTLLWHRQLSHNFDAAELLDKKNNFQRHDNDLKPAGLTAVGKTFRLNGKPITILSGAIHYFRIPEEYWQDRLLKMKACGLNTIETYVPWNLHEPIPMQYDFGGNLNLVKFIKLADKLGFFVLLRPGPYICSEWEFGGLPSWLLRDPDMKVRTMYGPFIKVVERYFQKLIPLVLDLQHSNGGPIIAFQVDNEYGSYYEDSDYIPYLKNSMRNHGIKELLFTSDNAEGSDKQVVPGILKTINFKNVKSHFTDLLKTQPNAPLMVMEFWTGWFDWWGEEHHTLSLQEYSETLNEILSAPASVNFYMFHGGTNFGFMNGGFCDDNGQYHADITSYDYDAIISENGDLTDKYERTKEIIGHYYPLQIKNGLIVPPLSSRLAYASIGVKRCMPLWDTLKFAHYEKHDYPLPMEMLMVNDQAGQSYGYTLYRTQVDVGKENKFTIAGLKDIHDRATFFIEETSQLFITKSKDSYNTAQLTTSLDSDTKVKLDILVENGGRINWKYFNDQRKGITGNIWVDDAKHKGWEIFALEMKENFIKEVSGMKQWKQCGDSLVLSAPRFFIFNLNIAKKPTDTYINMQKWSKGVIFVNGKNLGRYWSIGPQQKLFLPATWLKTGTNEILVYEETKYALSLEFSKN